MAMARSVVASGCSSGSASAPPGSHVRDRLSQDRLSSLVVAALHHGAAQQRLRGGNPELVTELAVQRKRPVEVGNRLIGRSHADIGPRNRSSHLGLDLGRRAELGGDELTGAIEHLPHRDRAGVRGVRVVPARIGRRQHLGEEAIELARLCRLRPGDPRACWRAIAACWNDTAVAATSDTSSVAAIDTATQCRRTKRDAR